MKSELVSGTIDFHNYLPPYRSLLTPHARYDYRTHSLVPLSGGETPMTRGSMSSNGGNNKATMKMKYKSLLSDVSRRTSMLSMRIEGQLRSNTSQSSRRNIQAPYSRITHLPPEILSQILCLVEFEDLKCTLLVCKQFYALTKPLLYKKLQFTSTYKFSMFVTYLRLNPAIAEYVREIDLSKLQAPNHGIEEGVEIGRATEATEVAAATAATAAGAGAGAAGAGGGGGGGPLVAGPPSAAFANLGNASFLAPDDAVAAAVPGSIPAHNMRPAAGAASMAAVAHAAELTTNAPTHTGSPQIYQNQSGQMLSTSNYIPAGWRDWKYKTNPVYSTHNTLYLTKTHSNSWASLKSAESTSSSFIAKRYRFSRLFMKRKFKSGRSHVKRRKALNNGNDAVNKCNTFILPNHGRRISGPHPTMNKMLLSYSSSKDIPVGSVLHLLSICTNLVSVNLGNLSLSVDYEVISDFTHQFESYDLIHNYPKDIPRITGQIIRDKSPLVAASEDVRSIFSILSLSHEEVVQNDTSSKKPRYVYQSLLPPLKRPSKSTRQGQGRLYLSDLNLKSINPKHLKKVQESEILEVLVKHRSTLTYVSLSRMIWLTKKMIQNLLCKLLENLPMIEQQDEDEEVEPIFMRKKMIVDLRDSGMYKNLAWADYIDMNEQFGCKLASRIVRDVLLEPEQYRIHQDRARRGRIGENYWTTAV